MLKRDSLDALFSNYVRTRDNWTCQRCKKYYPEGERQGLHCAHIFSRRHKGIRWHPENAIALCYGCHSYFTGYPFYFLTWVAERMGRERFDSLKYMSSRTTKLTKGDLEIIKKDLKAKLADLKKVPQGTYSEALI